MAEEVIGNKTSDRPGMTSDSGTEKASEQHAESENSQKNGEETNAPEVKKPSKLKQLWAKTQLDKTTLETMFKASLPPIIAISMFQAPPVARHYSTIGYLIAIASLLGFCIMPRAKFVQNMVFNVIAICIGAATNLLVLFCATQARQHTTPAGMPLEGYNSSASVVLAVWLAFQIYVVHSIRAARPQLSFQAILYSIFVNVSCTYGTQFPTMAASISFMVRLLSAFLTGFALCTGVAFLIFPTSCRHVVFKEMEGYLACLSGLLQSEAAYMQGLETFDLSSKKDSDEKGEGKDPKTESKDDSMKRTASHHPLKTPQSAKVKEMLAKTFELHTKLPADVSFAKREIAYGYIGAKDISELRKKMQYIMLPITGLSCIIDILRRRSEAAEWQTEPATEEESQGRSRQIDDLHYIMLILHEPFATMSVNIKEAFDHVLITLKLAKPPKKSADEENEGDAPAPGSPGFAEALNNKISGFYEMKKQTLNDWCTKHDIALPRDFFESNFTPIEKVATESERIRKRNQRQIFMVLYVEYLLYQAGNSALELVLFVEKRKQEGLFDKKRLILPRFKTIRKWVTTSLGQDAIPASEQDMGNINGEQPEPLKLGESFSDRKDPEHLPPSNAWEKIGDMIRVIPRVLGSAPSRFGFRVVCATMTLGVVCFLEASQFWFLSNRGLWAMIMVSISMTTSTGQSIQTFGFRIFGTFIATISSYLIWYIVDGHVPGVIVFLWLFMFCAFWFVLKKPQMLIVAILSIVTSVLIIGYELQVGVLGIKISESNGQPAYPTYELGAYRLATVVVGIGVAFIWTVFPFPVSETTAIREDLSGVLYMSANYCSLVRETIRSRLGRRDGDPAVKGSRAYVLEKARTAMFTKALVLLSNLEKNSTFLKFRPALGGRFPKEEYKG